MIEWPDRISYVLVAPGHDEDEFFVRVTDGELRADADGLEVRRSVGSAADPDFL